MIENNNKNISLYGNKLVINRDDIVVFNGINNILILCYQKKDKNKGSNVIIYYKGKKKI